MYKLSANSTDTSESKLGGEIVESYIFPASLNVRQEVSKKFKKKLFSSDELPKIKEFIINLKPKVVNESKPSWMKPELTRNCVSEDVDISEIVINDDEIDDDDDEEK
jgi:hypothetical protein